VGRLSSIGLHVVLVAIVVFWPVAASAAQSATPLASPTTGSSDAPLPVTFPGDDGPHETTTEWWYYTGHLFSAKGDRYGFEFVIFKGDRGGVAGYASHFAVTDGQAGRFQYDQRVALAAGVSRPGEGFDLTLDDWSMRGANGEDALRATLPDYAIDLELTSTKPPALHDGDGYFAYGDGTASYYYSRTRIAVTGMLMVRGEPISVTGEAWMDHQWGDFATYAGGGWDWFAVQFADDTDLMLYVIRDKTGAPVQAYGSLIDRAGELTALGGSEFAVTPTGSWTSPATGTTYPSGWRVTVAAASLSVTLSPVLADQELDTRATTGVIYWEGEVEVDGTRAGAPVAGLGYVELTGYAPFSPPSTPGI